MVLRGLFRHIRSGQLYFVEGLARDVKNPREQVVVYSQQYEGILHLQDENSRWGNIPHEEETFLPVGTMWTRSPQDFLEKFEKVPEPSKLERLLVSISNSLEKDIAYGYNHIDE